MRKLNKRLNASDNSLIAGKNDSAESDCPKSNRQPVRRCRCGKLIQNIDDDRPPIHSSRSSSSMSTVSGTESILDGLLVMHGQKLCKGCQYEDKQDMGGELSSKGSTSDYGTYSDNTWPPHEIMVDPRPSLDDDIRDRPPRGPSSIHRMPKRVGYPSIPARSRSGSFLCQSTGSFEEDLHEIRSGLQEIVRSYTRDSRDSAETRQVFNTSVPKKGVKKKEPPSHPPKPSSTPLSVGMSEDLAHSWTDNTDNSLHLLAIIGINNTTTLQGSSSSSNADSQNNGFAESSDDQTEFEGFTLNSDSSNSSKEDSSLEHSFEESRVSGKGNPERRRHIQMTPSDKISPQTDESPFHSPDVMKSPQSSLDFEAKVNLLRGGLQEILEASQTPKTSTAEMSKIPSYEETLNDRIPDAHILRSIKSALGKAADDFFGNSEKNFHIDEHVDEILEAPRRKGRSRQPSSVGSLIAFAPAHTASQPEDTELSKVADEFFKISVAKSQIEDKGEDETLSPRQEGFGRRSTPSPPIEVQLDEIRESPRRRGGRLPPVAKPTPPRQTESTFRKVATECFGCSAPQSQIEEKSDEKRVSPRLSGRGRHSTLSSAILPYPKDTYHRPHESTLKKSVGELFIATEAESQFEDQREEKRKSRLRGCGRHAALSPAVLSLISNPEDAARRPNESPLKKAAGELFVDAQTESQVEDQQDDTRESHRLGECSHRSKKSPAVLPPIANPKNAARRLHESTLKKAAGELFINTATESYVEEQREESSESPRRTGLASHLLSSPRGPHLEGLPRPRRSPIKRSNRRGRKSENDGSELEATKPFPLSHARHGNVSGLLSVVAPQDCPDSESGRIRSSAYKRTAKRFARGKSHRQKSSPGSESGSESDQAIKSPRSQQTYTSPPIYERNSLLEQESDAEVRLTGEGGVDDGELESSDENGQSVDSCAPISPRTGDKAAYAKDFARLSEPFIPKLIQIEREVDEADKWDRVFVVNPCNVFTFGSSNTGNEMNQAQGR